MELLKKTYEFDGKQYLVCSNGDIYGPTGVKLKHRPNHDGYATVTMGGKRRTRVHVHRLVANLFLPNPNGLSDADHLDGNRMNPALENLEWVTHTENVRRAHEKGMYSGRFVGENNPKAKLTTDIVMKLRAEYQSGITVMGLCKRYGYPWTTVDNAVKGRTWKHLPQAKQSGARCSQVSNDAGS